MGEPICHMCGNLTDPEYICETCDELVCEDCMVKFTIHNQIDYCLCKCCKDGQESSAWLQRYEDDKAQDELNKVKKDKAHKRWLKYHSPEQYEKRRLKKVELQKKRAELAEKRAIEIGRILSDIFKHM